MVEAAENGKMDLDEATWKFLCANQVHEVAPTVLAAVERWLIEMRYSNSFDDFIDRSKIYFHSLPDEDVKEQPKTTVTKRGASLFRLQR